MALFSAEQGPPEGSSTSWALGPHVAAFVNLCLDRTWGRDGVGVGGAPKPPSTFPTALGAGPNVRSCRGGGGGQSRPGLRRAEAPSPLPQCHRPPERGGQPPGAPGNQRPRAGAALRRSPAPLPSKLPEPRAELLSTQARGGGPRWTGAQAGAPGLGAARTQPRCNCSSAPAGDPQGVQGKPRGRAETRPGGVGAGTRGDRSQAPAVTRL